MWIIVRIVVMVVMIWFVYLGIVVVGVMLGCVCCWMLFLGGLFIVFVGLFVLVELVV